MTTSFSSVPIIDYGKLISTETKDAELPRLRHAIFGVGFLYLVNTGLEKLVADAHALLPELFALPQDAKEAANMRNSPAFLGYSCLGAETTAAQTDLREFGLNLLTSRGGFKQFDFGSPVPPARVDTSPIWAKLEGPSQFPDHERVHELATRYMSSMRQLAESFLQAVGECLSLPSTTFDSFLGHMDRLKFVKYPASAPGSQGVGPHKDSTGLFTFLSQDSVGGLQVLNQAGEWIDVPPIEGSLVVNIQQGFEAVTGGLCGATTHRVISPTEVTRYSIPYFLAVRLDLTLQELRDSAAHIHSLIPVRDDSRKKLVDVPSEFLSPLFSCFGEAQLRNRILSHADVGKRWYPELYTKYSSQVLT